MGKDAYDRLSGSKSPLHFNLKPRHNKFFLDPTQDQINAPAPNLYNISEVLTKPSRFLNDYMDFNRSQYSPNKQHSRLSTNQNTMVSPSSTFIYPGPCDYNLDKSPTPSSSEFIRALRQRTPLHLESKQKVAPVRDCSFAIEHSGEPYTPQGTIDLRPKINPPLSYQKMFRDDHLTFINQPTCPRMARKPIAPSVK